MSAERAWDLSNGLERRAHLNVAMSRDAKLAQLDAARRRANKMVSVLGSVASLLALYDLALLARMGS
jgi:hypothetical protein